MKDATSSSGSEAVCVLASEKGPLNILSKKVTFAQSNVLWILNDLILAPVPTMITTVSIPRALLLLDYVTIPCVGAPLLSNASGRRSEGVSRSDRGSDRSLRAWDDDGHEGHGVQSFEECGPG